MAHFTCPCISVVPEATHEASRGSKTETRQLLGGTEENSVSRQGVIDLPSRQITGKSMIFHKKEMGKNKLVTRPGFVCG